ncbi:RagB/SusD family nutrient uptake outer membrane protein [Myroides sp. LJL119]
MKIDYTLVKRAIYTVIGLTTLLFVSCDDYIEVDLPKNKMNREDVYLNTETTKAALNYLYVRLRDANFIIEQGKNLSLYTDELISNHQTPNDFHINNILSNNAIIGNWWNSAYTEIYNINTFIEGVKTAKVLSDLDKNQFLGEAYTIRAIYYQALTQLFGDIPYTVTPNYQENINIHKTENNLVLQRIESDLLQAVDLLSYDYRGSNRVYINRAVAEIILAENYLLQNKPDLAEKYCTNIIENPLYNLEEDINKIFKNDSKGTLLQMSPVVMPSTFPDVTFYLFTTITATSFSITESLYNSFDNNDLRKSYWINNSNINNSVYHQVYKYKNKTNNLDEFQIMYRLEKAYFLLSESLVKQEKTADAVEILNKVMAFRGVVPIPTTISKSSFIDKLLIESSKEFFTEYGMRFYDLKRNDELNSLSVKKENWQTYHNLFPLPDKETLINKNLLPNNIGY